MKKTKLLALALALVMVSLSMFSCLGQTEQKSDVEYIQDKGTLIIGMTEYVPMNYLDENDEWTGFDTEFALLAGKALGVDVEFIEIDWDNKWSFLEAKDVDCIWNGMTLTEEAKENASCTDTYVLNAQVVVTKAENAEKYTNAAALKDASVAVEAGSAGMSAAEAAELKVVEYTYQSDALMAVESGKADACVIDVTMANAMTGEGTSYDKLTKTFSLTEEEYAIACREGSDLCEKLNSIMADLVADGTLGELAKKYELTLVGDKK
ncbi:MAG: transporter substrate-binding domain-containing protein [Clostridia bacterium]|nr:transporter substrate-binding domain-containing protein [Clostridia bacterium]